MRFVLVLTSLCDCTATLLDFQVIDVESMSRAESTFDATNDVAFAWEILVLVGPHVRHRLHNRIPDAGSDIVEQHYLEMYHSPSSKFADSAEFTRTELDTLICTTPNPIIHEYAM